MNSAEDASLGGSLKLETGRESMNMETGICLGEETEAAAFNFAIPHAMS